MLRSDGPFGSALQAASIGRWLAVHPARPIRWSTEQVKGKSVADLIPVRRCAPEGEEGFVLIATIWLLVLAGSIVIVLVLRGMNDARDARSEGELLRQKLALDGAIETVIADRLFNGSRSQWSRVPAQGNIDADGIAVQVKSTSESGRLDLNVADLALIDRAFQGLGVGAGSRRIVLGRLQQLRGRGENLSSLAEMEVLLAEAQRDTTTCLADMVTMSSGLGQPRVGQMPAKLAFALGTTAGGVDGPANAEQFQAGEPQRLEAQIHAKNTRIAILRLSAQMRNGMALHAIGVGLCVNLAQQ